ncbi:hydroxypyruvate isomerase [Tranquillimonas rosea]|uniref:Hydroxypyruvate isomerase n=1 Tax=Tranquillimonas rosea TaxID=641238 RepID=A0A1H9WV03_9RHOB|nr:TIM barrel protein [Tranquillimonas rosea]SES37760.1 hydroxypyruvate isomerase [Tranquillimonas rosea]
MIRLSANLGFLWSELPLPDAIRAAKAAGFDAVECHWPYAEDATRVRDALDETGLAMLGLNTAKGARAGDSGLAAQPGREGEARAAIDEAFAYGARIGARAVHVMAGTANGVERDRLLDTFVANLHHACDRAREAGLVALIEPLNPFDNPDYALLGLASALDVLDRVGRPELMLMFDCYHLQITDGDLLRTFRACIDRVGHVQFAGVPDRGRPDRGEIAYDRLLPAMRDAGWTGAFGAEYRSGGRTEDSLGWMAGLQTG